MNEYLNIPTLVNAALIGLGGLVVRWGIRLDRSISDTAKVTAVLGERLNGHCEIADERHEGLKSRVETLERQPRRR